MIEKLPKYIYNNKHIIHFKQCLSQLSSLNKLPLYYYLFLVFDHTDWYTYTIYSTYIKTNLKSNLWLFKNNNINNNLYT